MFETRAADVPLPSLASCEYASGPAEPAMKGSETAVQSHVTKSTAKPRAKPATSRKLASSNVASTMVKAHEGEAKQGRARSNASREPDSSQKRYTGVVTYSRGAMAWLWCAELLDKFPD